MFAVLAIFVAGFFSAFILALIIGIVTGWLAERQHQLVGQQERLYVEPPRKSEVIGYQDIGKRR
jgi:hypothetical protein